MLQPSASNWHEHLATELVVLPLITLAWGAQTWPCWYCAL